MRSPGCHDAVPLSLLAVGLMVSAPVTSLLRLGVRFGHTLMWRGIAPLLLAITVVPSPIAGQEPGTSVSLARDFGGNNLRDDLGAYLSAPLRWHHREWLQFGGVVLAIGAAHQLDHGVRDHFVDVAADSPTDPARHALDDALPAAIALGGSWLYATLMDDSGGRRDSKAMIEAAVFSAGASTVLKRAFGRVRPDHSLRHGDWRGGGDAFPSTHVAAAFAIGTVLAESDEGSHRWLRRGLGYGMAAGTAWLRLDHNAHWLSDTVAGAGLGIATAGFIMHRHGDSADRAKLELSPFDGGLALTFPVGFDR